MAHVEKRGPHQWVAVYANPRNKSGRGAKTFPRRVDAERYLAVTQAAQLRQEWVDPKAGKRALLDYAEAWVAPRDLRPQTRDAYRQYLRRMEPIGHLPLASLTPSIIEAWQAGLAKTLAPATVNTTRGVLAAILKGAVRDQLIPVSPMRGVAALKETRTLVQPMPLETVISIAEGMRPHYRAAVWLGAGCGLRRGEAFGLCRDRINFLRNEIIVDQQVVEVDSVPVLGPPKTAASTRTVPMPAVVREALTHHLDTFPHIGPDEPLFTTMRGRLVRRTTFTPAWRRAGAPAGTRFHDLRHFYASSLIEGGESVIVVQARLGHATAEETLGTYGHLWPNSAENTRRVLDAMFASPQHDVGLGLH